MQRGDVYRLGDYPFADAVVTYVDEVDITLARPYIYASETSRQPLMGFEHIVFSKEELKNYKKIDEGRTY